MSASVEECFFIETIESLPCIWNLKHPSYKNKVVIEAAWSSIASTIEESIERCQEIWKSIRLKYIRERKFVRKMPSGSVTYTGNWELFKKLGFLAPFIQIRRKKSNFSVKRKIESVEGDSKVWHANDNEMLLTSGCQSTATSSEADCEEIAQESSTITECEPVPSKQTPIFLQKITKETPILLSRERNVQKQQENEYANVDMAKIARTVSTVGESLQLFLRQNQVRSQEGLKQEDYSFAVSLAWSLSKIKSDKKKLLLKAKFLTMAADCFDSESD